MTSRRRQTWYLVTLAFVGGFSMMVVEVTAARILAPFFGTSVFTWTNVIGAILAALAAGYYLGGLLADRRPRVDVALWILTIAGGMTVLVPFAAPVLANALVPGEGMFVSAAPLFIRASLLVSLLIFAPPVFVMGALSPLVVRLLSEQTDVGRASGLNSAVGTAGALTGTFAPTLVLVPLIGSRRTVILAGLLLLGLALTGFVVARRRPPAVLAALLFASGAAALAPAVGPFERIPGLVEEIETRYQLARVVRNKGVTELRLEGQRAGSQSLRRDDSVLTAGGCYDYLLVLPYLAELRQGQQVDLLVLGLGAGVVPRQYRHFYGDEFDLRMDGVELDGGVIDLARRHFGLQEDPRHRVVVGDARTFLRTTDRTYDLIVVDVVANEVFVPFHLASREFFQELKARLKPNGVLGMNIVVKSLPSRLVTALEGSVLDVFGKVLRLRPPGTTNVELIARNGAEIDVLAAGRQLMASANPAAEWQQARATMVNGMVYLTRVDPAGHVPLTDDLAPTEYLMLQDMRAAWSAR